MEDKVNLEPIITSSAIPFTGGAVALASSAALTAFQSFIPISAPALYGISGTLLMSSINSFRDGIKLHKKWSNIRNPKARKLDIDNIPYKEGHTFLGWGSLIETEDVQNYERHKSLHSDIIKSKKYKLGGNNLLHGLIKHKEVPLFQPLRIRDQHSVTIGSTGVGKTRSLELDLVQILKLRDCGGRKEDEKEKGHGKGGQSVVIIDPKGDEVIANRTYEELKKNGEEDRFVFVSLAHPDISAKYNPLENFDKVSDIPDRIVPLLGTGEGSSKSFIDYCHGVLNVVCQAMDYAGLRITFKELLRYCIYDTPSLMRELLVYEKIQKEGEDSPKIDLLKESLKTADEIRKKAIAYREQDRAGTIKGKPQILQLAEMIERDAANHGKMINSLKPLLSKLATDKVGDLLSPGLKDENVFSWKDAIDKGKVVYLYLGTLIGKQTAQAVGKMALLDCKAVIGGIYAHNLKETYVPINLYIDEASQVAVHELVDLMNQGRGAGLRVNLYFQTDDDLVVALGGQGPAAQMLGNSNVNRQMRDMTFKTAERYSKKCGMRNILYPSYSSQVSPSLGNTGNQMVGSFQTRSGINFQEKEVPLVSVDMIQGLPIGQAIDNFESTTYITQIPMFDDPKSNFLVQIGAKSA